MRHGCSTVVRQSSTSTQLRQDRIDMVRYTCHVESISEGRPQHPCRFYSCRSSRQHTHPGRSTGQQPRHEETHQPSRIRLFLPSSTPTSDAQDPQPRRSTASRISSHSFENRLLQRHPRWTAGRDVATITASHECCCPIRRRSRTARPHFPNDARTPLASNPATHRLQARNNNARDCSWFPHRNTCATKSRQFLTCRVAATCDLRRTDCFMSRVYEHVMDREPSPLLVQLFGTVYHKPFETFPLS